MRTVKTMAILSMSRKQSRQYNKWGLYGAEHR
jgi:hypothetical protein